MKSNSLFRLSIASAHAFLLVYSVTNPMSFLTVKQRFEEIRELRSDFQVLMIHRLQPTYYISILLMIQTNVVGSYAVKHKALHPQSTVIVKIPT